MGYRRSLSSSFLKIGNDSLPSDLQTDRSLIMMSPQPPNLPLIIKKWRFNLAHFSVAWVIVVILLGIASAKETHANVTYNYSGKAFPSKINGATGDFLAGNITVSVTFDNTVVPGYTGQIWFEFGSNYVGRPDFRVIAFTITGPGIAVSLERQGDSYGYSSTILYGDIRDLYGFFSIVNGQIVSWCLNTSVWDYHWPEPGTGASIGTHSNQYRREPLDGDYGIVQRLPGGYT
jgi:hypothetical protein